MTAIDRIPWIALLLLLLSGCSLINVAYNNADTAVYWFVDDYLDFNPDQRGQFDQGLRRLHAWHRRVELPKYAGLCTVAAGRVEARLKPADLDWLEGALRARYVALMNFSASDLAAVLVTVEPSQLIILDAKFAKTNEKFSEEHLSGTPAAREKKRVKEALERIVDWIGDLEPEQETRVVSMLKALPQMAEHRYAQRLARQKALREMLAARLTKDRLEPALKDWLINWESGRTAEHQRIWALWLRQNRQIMLELDAMLTPQQRAHLVHKLLDYAENFNRLHQG